MTKCEWDKIRRKRGVTKLKSKTPLAAQQIHHGVKNGGLFGLISCDIRVPKQLEEYFEEMTPIFKNCKVSRGDISSI